MLKQEWKKLLNNKWLQVVIIAVIAIPTIYTTLFLGSMWDPYGNVDKLPVAVVNQDQQVYYKDTQLNIGKELVEKLKEDSTLAFNFVDSETARRGLKNGTYYMIITIPKDFSKNAATLTDKQPQKMELTYETNPGTNYIASKMSETAMKEIQSSICEEVTKTYTEALFDQITKAGDGMLEAADGSGEIKDGAQQLSDGNNLISENLRLLADSSLTFKDGSNTLNVGLKKYVDGVSTVASGATQLDDGVGKLQIGLYQLNANVPTLSSGVEQLTKGAVTLADGISSAKSGAATLADGTASVDAKLNTLNEGLAQLKSSTATLPDSAEKLNTGTASLAHGTTSLKEGMTQLSHGTDKLQAGADQLNSGLQNIVGQNNAQSTALSEGANQLSAAIGSLVGSGSSTTSTWNLSDIQNIAEQLQQQGASLGNSGAQITRAADNLSTVSGGEDPSWVQSQIDTAAENNDIEALKSAALQALGLANKNYQAAQTASSLCQVSKNSMETAGTALTQAASDLNASGIKLANITSALGNQITDSGSSDSAPSSQLQTLKQKADELATSVTAYTEGVNQAAAGSKQLAREIPVLKSGINGVTAGLNQLDNGITTLHDGTFQLSVNAPALANGIQEVADGSSALRTQGTAVLKKGASDLLNGLNALDTGSLQMKTGTQNLNAQIPTLSGGISQIVTGADKLKAGTRTLVSGTSELTANNSTLLNGAGQLSDGAGQISDGANQLYSGSEELGSGIQKIYDGADTLQSSLADGADQIEDTNTDDSVVEMFAAPVNTDETQITTVENNGHAMAPYMMSVALWVGCIAFSLMYPLTQYYGKLKSGTSWWLSKASVLYLIAILQALVMIGALHLFDGFNPVEMGRTLLVAVIASLAFMSIMYFFTNLLGKVGSFLMLVFMVIQLAGSVGTYPLELSGSFVKYLHDWVPFTYTVKAFRSTISGGEDITGCLIFLLILFIVFSLLTVLEFRIRAKKIKAEKSTLTEWLEEHGLA